MNKEYVSVSKRFKVSKVLLIVFCFLFIANGFAQADLENITSPNRLPYLKNSTFKQIASYDTTGGNNDRINLKPGEKKTIAEMEGPGMITRIWVTIDSRDPYFLRRIVLRMYWDGETKPSVEVPIGDFFGNGFEYTHHLTEFVGMSSGGYYSYFAMPFGKSARIEIENETGQEVYAFYYHIGYQQLHEPLADDAAYFHSQWNREIKTDPGKNYTVLDAEGVGHFVGLNLQMQAYNKTLWFLEGDEMVYVDGEKFPSMYGTGTEDYFTSGWYFRTGTYYAPYHGCIMLDDSLGRVTAYRFHVGDVIPFTKSLQFTIEHGHGNEETGDYASVAYWYQKEPHKPFKPLLPGPLRIPLRHIVPEGVVEAESLTPGGVKTTIEDMTVYGPDWSGGKQISALLQPQEKVVVSIPTPTQENYNVDIHFTKGPGYGDFDIYNDGKKVGELKGEYTEVYPADKLTLQNLSVKNNIVTLEFVCTGGSKKAPFSFGVDAFFLDPVRHFIPDWYVIGPFANPRDENQTRLGIDVKYPPETEFDTTKVYDGVDGQKVAWKLGKMDKRGRFHLNGLFKPEEMVVAYAATWVYSSKEQTVPMLIGSDDGVKVFINDKEIHRFLEVRVSAPDQDMLQVKLNEGWNKLVLKIENGFGGYAFFARFIDSDNTLTCSPKKQKP